MIWQPEFKIKHSPGKPGRFIVINTYKPEDQLFVSGIHKEGYSGLRSTQRHRQNYQSAELLRLLRQRSHRREASRHSGEVCFFEGQVFVYGL
ncbi:hypothetical protein H6S13_26165 (plasmid) [Escherichia coli]|nr:hypothetical protein H6S13_26165 [Escherichia coli]